MDLDGCMPSRYIDGMDDLRATRELLSRQLAEAIAKDPIGTLPSISALQKETDEHLREAVRQAALSSSWREIAAGLGVSKQAAEKELDEWLERFSITANRKKKIEELSKGNQQKVQFLATILHDPTILIMDEPFSGLDPVNANVLKEAFLEMHSRGKTIIFSTHQLEQVEELCQDIVIINKGQSVAQGSVREVKRQRGRNVARLKLDNDPEARWLDTLEGVQVTKRRQDYIEMHIQANLNPNLIVEAALQHGGIISRFELAEPSLTDIFIEYVGASALPDAPAVLSA